MSKPKTIYLDEHKALCEWLNTKRNEQSVSIRALALQLGWAPSIVGKICTGDRRMDVIEYAQICMALDIDACEGLSAIKHK